MNFCIDLALVYSYNTNLENVKRMMIDSSILIVTLLGAWAPVEALGRDKLPSLRTP
jgi:ABC-type nickel/cobalt efflux system permease component RcnA